MGSIFFSFDRPIALKTPHPPVYWGNPIDRTAPDSEPAGPTSENPYRACTLYIEEDSFPDNCLYGAGNSKSRHPAKVQIVVHRDYKVKVGEPIKTPVLDAVVCECLRRLDYVERVFRLPQLVHIPDVYCGVFLRRYRRQYSCTLLLRVLNWEPSV